VIVQTANAG
jgi:GntR family transcriptional regulator, transcriptional repressor for pyruvate dehydrogenase complex